MTIRYVHTSSQCFGLGSLRHIMALLTWVKLWTACSTSQSETWQLVRWASAAHYDVAYIARARPNALLDSRCSMPTYHCPQISHVLTPCKIHRSYDERNGWVNFFSCESCRTNFDACRNWNSNITYTHWRDYCKSLTFSISSRWNRRTCIACTIYTDTVS